MRKLFIFLFICFAGLSFGQVTSVDYLMKYNCQTNQYDISIIILEGSASNVPNRIQFNSQISIVVPTGQALQITDKYMPLQNNQNYNGTVPMDWILTNPTYAPEVQPANDFFGIIPKLNVTSSYNDLEAGDVVKLFSITVGDSGEYDESVRFYDNNVDPGYDAPGMGAADYSNGFTLGNIENIYNDNVEEPCVLASANSLSHPDVKVYPNPIQDVFFIELPYDVESIRIIGTNGKVHYQSKHKPKGKIKIDASQFPSGMYYIYLDADGRTSTHKIVKF